MPDNRPHIFGLTPDTLAERVIAWGLPRYRAGQILEWVYRHGVADPQRMTNLPRGERALLAERLRFVAGRSIGHQGATDGTQKLLIQWPSQSATAEGGALPVLDGGAMQTECVMIPSRSSDSGPGRKTACVSSQVGCPVGCRFCASGLGGLEANLTAGQIVEQAWRLAGLDGVDRLSHVVFMGMGEPLANLGAVAGAVRTLMADWGMAIAGRRITVSTVGLPAQMRRLADMALPITLAISLHAPNDALRRALIPWAEHVSVDQLIDAGRYYFERTHREVTLEYILLGGVNDRPEHARELAEVARKLRSNVNLIRYNEVAGLAYDRPATADVRRFHELLRRAHVNAHIRASRGRDIAAACGQLRHENQQRTDTRAATAAPDPARAARR